MSNRGSKERGKKDFLFATTLLAGVATAFGGVAVAQDTVPAQQEAEAEEDEEEAVVVTGSRIRRNEFTSSQPIQVIDAQASRNLGIVDTAGMLQDSIAAGGTQVDGSFLNTSAGSGASNATEAPPNGGPGSASVSLRGLDAERTLVLLNGRRLAPAGAGGAPTRPDVNLLPSSMIERVEILTGGASAIYGADAVAGVVNMITRQNFEGLELQAFRSQPDQAGGEISQLNFIMGANGERSNVTFAAEYYQRDRIGMSDRDFAHCLRDIVELYSGDGDVIPANNGTNVANIPAGDPRIGDRVGTFEFCRSDFPDNSVFTLSTSRLLFYQPGQMDPIVGGNPLYDDWSRRVFGSTFATPPFGPGQPNGVYDNIWRFDDHPEFVAQGGEFGEFNDNDDRLGADLQQPLQRFALYTQGEFEFDNNSEAYFEAFYGNRQVTGTSIPEQALPIIPAEVPQLNPAGDDFERDGLGNLILYDNPLNPFPEDVEGILTLSNDFDQIRRTEVEQIRFGGGWRGEINGIGYDFWSTYDRTIGFLSQKVLFEPAVFFGTTAVFLGNDGAPGLGTPTCGVDPRLGTGEVFTTMFDFFSPQVNANGECVPLDWLNLSVLEDDRFATQAEADFAFATRINRTLVEQAVFGANFFGELWEMQGGNVAWAFGLEHRIDEIESVNDVVVERGLQASETVQSEGSTGGTTYQNDVYLEMEFPFLSGQPMAENLTLNAAVRYTSEKNFGNETTYSIRGNWDPTEWLSFRGAYATSFRAPNLREQFLAQNASGVVGSSTDPCNVPAIAIDPGPVYNAGNDPRSANLLAACVLSGADPTQLGLDGFSISVPTFTSGVTTLEAETAESYSVGFVVSNPWRDLISADLAVTYWNIEVVDTVEELGAADVIFGCLNNDPPPFSDPLCSRLSRASTGNPRRDFLSGVETSFRNIGAIEVDGYDVNLRLQKEFGDLLVTFTSANTLLEGLSRQDDAEDPSTLESFEGTGNNSEWESRNTLAFGWGDFTATWRSSFVQGTVMSNNPAARSVFFSSTTTCGFPVLNQYTPRVCREVDYVDDYWKHDASLNYANDEYSFTIGVNNLFDEEPPRISRGYTERNNNVIGGNYDLYGRTIFANLRRTF